MENKEFKRNQGLEFVGLASLEIGLLLEKEKHNEFRNEFNIERARVSPTSRVVSLENTNDMEAKL